MRWDCHPPHCWAWLPTSGCCISPSGCRGSCYPALLAPLLSPTLPLANTPGPLLVSATWVGPVCPHGPLAGPSPRLSLCPPIGQGGLPRAGGDVFSLVRHSCQKHLVYKLASASRLPLHSSGRWTDKAEAPGPLPPAPGLGHQAHVHPWPPTHNPAGGRPPAAGLLSRTQPDLDGTTEGGVCRDIWGASTWIRPRCQVPVESHEGRTGAMQRLCSPHPLASLPLRQEKSAMTGPGRPGPGGPRSSAHSSSSNIWLLSAWGIAWPVLAEAG